MERALALSSRFRERLDRVPIVMELSRGLPRGVGEIARERMFFRELGCERVRLSSRRVVVMAVQETEDALSPARQLADPFGDAVLSQGLGELRRFRALRGFDEEALFEGGALLLVTGAPIELDRAPP